MPASQSPQFTSTLFDQEFIRKLQYLQLVSSRLRPGHLKGEHRAKRTGSGVEFADFRPYTYGADSQSLDWDAYLRLGKLVLRLFEEEADLPIYIMIDASASMGFGSPDKFDYARRLAAALGYVGLANLDRLSLLAYSDDIRFELPPVRGKGQFWSVLRFLEGLEAEGTTSLGRSVTSFLERSRRKGLVVLITDFLEDGEIAAQMKRFRMVRHELFVIQVISPQEKAPQLDDEIELLDRETGKRLKFHVSPGLLAEYEKLFQAHCRQVQATCAENGWGYAQAQTAVPFEDLILDIFRNQGFLR